MRIVKDGEKVFEWVNADGTSPIVLVCEHASNFIPDHMQRLGLEEADVQRHIAYDIGAANVAQILARELDAPLILNRYSRLIYDCNRAPEHEAAMPKVSEVYAIPSNKNLSVAQKQQRVDEIYRPFHRALEDMLDGRAVRGQVTALVSIHSFTRVFRGHRRDVDLGLLFDRDDRLATAFGKGPKGFIKRFNEPYNTANGVTHVINLHGYARGLPHLMIEICNDLIVTREGQNIWAKYLAAPLADIAKDIK